MTLAALDAIRTPVVPLQSLIPGASAGIFVTEAIAGAGGVAGLGAQFLAEAAVYDERYFNPAFSAALSGALDRGGGLRGVPRRILDIGCGSGNATFGLLHLFPEATVLASDLSPDLLELLLRRVRAAGQGERVVGLVADAATLELAEGAFDLLVGSSFLHHLVDPGAALQALLRGVAPGGMALFFEPFLPGYFVMRQVIHALLALDACRGGLREDDVAVLRQFAFGIDFVSTTPRSDPVLATLDDKWLFTKAQFTAWADAFACDVVIYTTNPPDETIGDKLASLMASATGRAFVPPAWAQAFLAEQDAPRRGLLREDLLMEGGIVFRKR